MIKFAHKLFSTKFENSGRYEAAIIIQRILKKTKYHITKITGYVQKELKKL